MRLILVVMGCLLGTLGLRAQDLKPEEIINRAIIAGGGAELFNKYPAGRVVAKGELTVGANKVPVEVEQVYAVPGRSRTLIRMETRGQKQDVLHVVNGLRVRYSINGTPIPTTEASARELQQVALLLEIGQLTPLLNDKKFTLKPDKQAKGADLAGVIAQVKGSPDVRLGFDLKTGHLVRITRKVIDPDTAKEGELEQVLMEYKAVAGLSRPTRSLLFKDGQKILDLTTESFAPLEKVESREFITEE